MKPKKQIVYHPVRVEDELPDKNYSDELHSDCGLVGFENGVFGKWDNNKGVWNHPIKVRTWLKIQEGYFFTPEQLNEYTANVIKQALETAAENAFISNHIPDEDDDRVYKKVSKQSITNTFEETFKNFEV